MPKLLQDAQRDIDFKMIDSDKIDEDQQIRDEQDDQKGLYVDAETGRKYVSINSNALEVKINSLEVMKQMARSLGPSFSMYV